MATTTSTASSSFSTRSNIIPVFVLLCLILASAEVAGEPPDVVPLACNDAYAAARQLTTVDFCLSVLEGHSAGAADYNDLAIFAVNFTTANATATKTKIDGLVADGEDGNNSALVDGLRSCQGLYDAVVRQYQPDCYAAVTDRRYGDARSCLGRTVDVARLCEQWFRQREVASPVAQDDDNLTKLANLAIALTMVVA